MHGHIGRMALCLNDAVFQPNRARADGLNGCQIVRYEKQCAAAIMKLLDRG